MEKIRKIYQKLGIDIDGKTLNTILEDKERTKSLLRLYKQEEISAMNYVLEKEENNKTFTKEELEFVNIINLFDRKLLNWSRLIWKNRNNTDNLLEIQNAVNEGRCPKCI